MIYTSIFLLRARQELLDAWIWYEERQPGLGDRFKNELYKRIYKIEQTPERYPERKKPYRETRVEIFPYLIIYRISKKEKLIIISSIFHTSRNQKRKYKT